jgi:flagellar motility protein MotE (MotC chaperone)
MAERRTDRIILSRASRDRRNLSPAQRRSYLWTLAGGLVGSTILLWIMVQLGQASDPKSKATLTPARPSERSASHAAPPSSPVAESETDEQSLAPPAPALQGPALDTPREILDMLDLRKRDLDRREEAIRQQEERLVMVKAEIEQLLTKNEALEKRLQQARAKQEQQATDAKAEHTKAQLERERRAQAQKNESQAQLAKMYETMAPEEAAARLERMPDRKAVEILRLVKGKTAGAILAQIKVDRAAKLTEQLLTLAP